MMRKARGLHAGTMLSEPEQVQSCGSLGALRGHGEKEDASMVIDPRTICW